MQVPPRRHRPIDERPSLIEKAESHIDRAQGIHQGRLDCRLLRQLAVNSRGTLVEHFPRRHRVAARLAGVGDLEQIDQKARGLLGGARLGLGAYRLALRRATLDERIRGETSGQHHACHRRTRECEQAAIAALLLAPPERIEADPEQSGDELEAGVILTVLAGTRVRCNRFSARRTELAVRPEAKAQRRRKALLFFAPGQVGRIRLAADDQAENAVLAAQALERQNFLVDPLRLCSLRRADHDLIGRVSQGRVEQGPQIRGARQFVAVSEDRCDALGHLAARGHGADQCLRGTVFLERRVQPGRPTRITMAVADEGAVFGRVHAVCFRA